MFEKIRLVCYNVLKLSEVQLEVYVVGHAVRQADDGYGNTLLS